MSSKVVCLCSNNDARVLAREVNRLKDDVDGLNARVATLTEENADLKGQLLRAENVKVMMKNVIRGASANIADLKNQRDVADQEKREMVELMQSYSAFRDIEVKDLREKIAELQSTIDRLTASP
jgi:uncharacterized small protein (DUF1192 family)